MNRRFALLAALALACTCFTGLAIAQDSASQSVPRFVTLPQHPQVTVPATNLTQWNGTFKDLTGTVRNFTMVGTDPHKSNVTSTIPLIVVPVKIVFDKSHGNRTFDPNKNKFKGQTVSVTKTILNSPIMQSNVDFVQGGTDLGKTQYIDAFQRGNFWSVVKKNNKYHVLLSKATVLPEQTINCNTGDCAVSTQFGHVVGLMDINHFDSIVQGYISKFSTKIQPNTLPLFLIYDTYLTSGGCCIGGYHSANGGQPGGQTYSVSSTIDQGTRTFSQDTAALSHEIGEWMDDPFVDNRVGCNDNSILEVGDPLVLDDHAYTVGSFTYHLQDMVWIGYFGAPAKTSLLSWLSFQNDEKHVCPGQ